MQRVSEGDQTGTKPHPTATRTKKQSKTSWERQIPEEMGEPRTKSRYLTSLGKTPNRVFVKVTLAAEDLSASLR